MLPKRPQINQLGWSGEFCQEDEGEEGQCHPVVLKWHKHKNQLDFGVLSNHQGGNFRWLTDVSRNVST